MGNALQVTGNNISNINTVGFKKGRSTFADTLYENVATLGGTDQIGRGMAIGDVAQNFNQGSFESTGNTTDLSIGGDGFFIVRQDDSENMYYTRAGNFYFNKDGELVNPEGYVVQGWALDEDTGDDVGAIGDIILQAFTSAPKTTDTITAITNLDADSTSNSIVLSNNWDSSDEPYISTTSYEYQTVIPVYDALGSTHNITIYYDKKSGTEWEYIVTCNPSEDKRTGVEGTDSTGLMARGSITFSQSSGDIQDLTMSVLSGRVSNWTANGVNTVDDIHYEILDSEALGSDGYGFAFEFDGSSWDFVDEDSDGIISTDEKPDNYPNATIVYSDSQKVEIVLNQTSPTDTDPDLIITLDQAAVALDSFGFDINAPTDLHVQGIDNTRYFGDTANDNTTLEINDPSVLTHDSTGLGIIWNPNVGGTGAWYWSNPEIAASAGTLISGTTLTNSTGGTVTTNSATTVVTNAEDLSMVASGVSFRYDGTQWDWNDSMKAEDFNNTYTFLPTNDPALSVLTAGSEGAIATNTALATPTLYWLGNAWSLTSTGAATTSGAIGNTTIVINTAASSDTAVVFDMWYNDSSGASTIQYSFGSALTTAADQSIDFTIDPSPPQEYGDAAITYSTAGTQSFYIDFDGDNTLDLTVNPTAGGAATAAGAILEFDIDPDVPPTEYADATLKGDQESVVIDLDGSGNDSDNDDIVFKFEDNLKYGSATHPYDDRSEIDFDIIGSTAWTEIDKDDIEDTGYYSFMADFLGGEYGSTETDISLNFGSVYEDNAFVNGSLSTTQYSKSSSTVYQDANGYAAGDLQGVDVSSDGVMTGIYSNGQLIPLFRVGLAKFLNNYGLSNEGGNLFQETRASGAAITNKPGENGLGTISPNSLEMSNVDISEEFVNMITNQRGFQANSKTITTVDSMMQTVIQMKQ
jgi:flagellar hook protein FlgE